MKAYVSCVGCEQRELDSQRVINYLHTNGLEITKRPLDADYLFVITCGVDSTNQEKSLAEIERVANLMRDGAKLMIGGCLPAISPEELSKFNIYHSFSPRTIESLDGVLDLDTKVVEVNSPNRSIFDEDYNLGGELSARKKFENAKDGYKVTIAQGCIGACSYCMIREATGGLESKPLDEVVEQIAQGVRDREQTIMLMAGDTGAYGQDIGTNLFTLLRRNLELPGSSQIYIHDFGVNWLIKDLNEYLGVFELAEKTKRIGGITFPVQSGSDSILKQMNRRYKREDVINALQLTKSFSFDIGTHIMVGFPSETDDDFDATLSLLTQIDFDFVTCFPYSEHPKAKSTTIRTKVDRTVVEERLTKISNLLSDKVKVIR